MTDNIVSSIARSLTPEVVDKMAAAAGLDRDAAHLTVGASVPAILNELVNISQKPGGAREIVNALADQPASILSNIMGSLSVPAPLADKGKAVLSSLFGNHALGLLSAAVSRFTGTSDASTRTIMGLVAPVILGTIGFQQRAQGLDASGISRMLQDQKGNIADALPSGLAKLLPETETLDPMPQATPRGDVRPPIPNAAARRAAAPARASWAYWVLPAAVLAALLWYLLPENRVPQQASAPVNSTPSTTASKAPAKDTDLTASAIPKSGFFSRAQDNWVSVNTIGNQEVYNTNGEKLGSVSDLLVGPDGRIIAAVVNVGSFLGIGEKRIAMPYSALNIERRENGPRLVVITQKDALIAAPAFQPMPEHPSNAPQTPANLPTTRP